MAFLTPETSHRLSAATSSHPIYISCPGPICVAFATHPYNSRQKNLNRCRADTTARYTSHIHLGPEYTLLPRLPISIFPGGSLVRNQSQPSLSSTFNRCTSRPTSNHLMPEGCLSVHSDCHRSRFRKIWFTVITFSIPIAKNFHP